MSDYVDHYVLLELAPDATVEEIETAFHRLIRPWHPANYPAEAPREIQDLAAERTRQLIEARQTLVDPARRRAFDERRDAVLNHRPDGQSAAELVPIPQAPAEAGSEAPAAGDVRSALAIPAKSRTTASDEHLGNGRLAAWLVLTLLLAAGGYAVGSANWKATGDESYLYSTAIAGIVFTAVMLALVVWITPGIRVRDLLALRRPAWPRDVLALRPPTAWSWALGAGLAIVVGSFVFSYLYDSVFGPFDPDGSIATFWDGSRAPQFALNLVVVAVLVPIEEELMYRGLGFALLERFGTWTAILGTAALFGLAHGYVLLLPVFIVAGLALGWLRARTASVYPGMLVHGTINGAVTVLAVAFGTS